MESSPLLKEATRIGDDGEDTQSSQSDNQGPFTPSSEEASSTTEESSAKTIWWRLSEILVAIGIFTDVAAKEEMDKKFGYDKFINRTPEHYPAGIPRLAAFTSYDRDLIMYRRFNYLHDRNIVQLEIELEEVHKEMMNLDEQDSTKEAEARRAGKGGGPAYRLRYTRHEEGWDSTQRDLMRKSRLLLKEYRELVFGQLQFDALNPPSKRAHRSYFNYIRTSRPKMLVSGYDDFVRYPDDFITLSTRRNPLRSSIQDLADWLRGWSLIRWLLCTRVEKSNDGSATQEYFSDAAMDGLVVVSLSVLCLSILLVPSTLLFLVPMTRSMMAVVSSLGILIFSAIIAQVTDADIYKVLVGTSSFAAFVVIFQGNLNQCNTACSVS